MLISENAHNSLSPSELRDKRLLVPIGQEITSISIATPGREKISLERQKSGDWKISEPVTAFAVKNIVNEFLGAMTGSVISGFMEEGGEKLDEYGFAPPVAQVIFHTGFEGTLPTKVFFGGKTPGGSRYAKSDLHDSVVRVPAELYEDAPLTVEKLRDLTLIPFNVDEISKVEVERKGDPLTLISEKVNGENKWSVIRPKDLAIDPHTTTSAIYEISVAKALAVVAESGNPAKYDLDNPKIIVTVTGSDKKVEKLKISHQWKRKTFGTSKKRATRQYMKSTKRESTLSRHSFSGLSIGGFLVIQGQRASAGLL